MSYISLKNVLRPGFSGRSFKSGYRFQRHWDTPMATAFFCGEAGAGVFLISMLINFLPGAILGLFITGIGKTFFHLTHMGVPSKSWRAILRPDRSWVSRGLWGIIFFVGFGGVHVAGQLFGIVPDDLMTPTAVLAMAGAMMVLVYQGFAMSHSSAISLWNTGLMPMSSMLYGATSGVSLILLLTALGVPIADTGHHNMLILVQPILLVGLFMMLFSLLHSAKNGSKGAQQSYDLMTRDFLVRPFLGGVVGIGLILPLLLILFAPMNVVMTGLATGSILVGFFAYRIVIFKAGVLDPIFDPANGLFR